MSESLHFGMHCGVATPAERLKVVKFVVPFTARRGHSIPVNVMDVQIVGRAASLAGMAVSFKRGLPIPVEHISVFGQLSVLRNLFRISRRPASDMGNVEGHLTVAAPPHWPASVFKVIPAVDAGRHSTNSRSSSRLAFGSMVCRVICRQAGWSAAWAGFLVRSGRLEADPANDARLLREAGPSLAVGAKCARLASPHVRRGFRRLIAAIWARQNSVFSLHHVQLEVNRDSSYHWELQCQQ